MNMQELHALQDKAISSIRNAKHTMQEALVLTLRHAWKHGDYTVANRLIAGFGDSKDEKIHKDAILGFLVRFGGLDYDKETNTFNGWKGAQHIEDNFLDAKGTHWTTLRYKPETPAKVYNVNDKLTNILDELEGKGKKGGIVTLDSATLTKLVAFLASHDAVMVAEALASSALADALGLELVVTEEREAA